ncbi:MAG: NOP58 family protein [Candidatus Diapherotrites archaeon]|uniref:NOP58 family protein n=1 Tax=Candidatus Iainarchaeum sp. TaxID=3101447 RepID=A0A8T3YL01_9ARCH|nr:NOP58 family protein [Candidatus Diapherotrites archaeon]
METIEELRKKLISSARRNVQEKYSEKDVHIIKAVNILEDLDPIANLLIEQLREWHAVHFPELNDLVHDNDTYAKLVAEIGNRAGFTGGKAVMEIVKDEALAEKIAGAVKGSMGAQASEKDIAEIKALALNCTNLRQEREYLAKYIEQEMNREMPNFTQIAGAIIGAKILAKAGGKKKLAFMPASTIQLIGAEKALFMHFRNNVPGPKYGYLFQHPLVKAARDDHKGRIARSIAAKLAIAARVDYFRGDSKTAEIGHGLEERAQALEKLKAGPRKKAAQATAPVTAAQPPQARPAREEYRRERPERGEWRPRREERTPRAQFHTRRYDERPQRREREDDAHRGFGNRGRSESAGKSHYAGSGYKPHRPAAGSWKGRGERHAGFGPRRDEGRTEGRYKVSAYKPHRPGGGKWNSRGESHGGRGRPGGRNSFGARGGKPGGKKPRRYSEHEIRPFE